MANLNRFEVSLDFLFYINNREFFEISKLPVLNVFWFWLGGKLHLIPNFQQNLIYRVSPLRLLVVMFLLLHVFFIYISYQSPLVFSQGHD